MSIAVHEISYAQFTRAPRRYSAEKRFFSLLDLKLWVECIFIDFYITAKKVIHLVKSYFFDEIENLDDFSQMMIMFVWDVFVLYNVSILCYWKRKFSRSLGAKLLVFYKIANIKINWEKFRTMKNWFFTSWILMQAKKINLAKHQIIDTVNNWRLPNKHHVQKNIRISR